MLSQENRFSLKTDRFRVESTGRTIHSSLFTAIVSPRPEIPLPVRFAFLIGKKSFPLSVTRHALKRHLSEVVRHNLDILPQGLDVILIPKKICQTAPSAEILTDLQNLLKR